MQILGSNDVAFDARFQFGDFIKQIRRNCARKNERLQVLTELIEQFAVSRDASSLDQSHAFPRLTVARIVIFHAVKRTNKGAVTSLRPQPHIDSEKRVSGRREDLNDFFCEPGKKLVVGKPRVKKTLFTVEEYQIDIGTVIQLDSPELSHSQNSKAGLGPAPFLRKMFKTGGVDFVNTVLRDGGYIASGLREPGKSRNLAKADSQHFLGFPCTQSSE